MRTASKILEAGQHGKTVTAHEAFYTMLVLLANTNLTMHDISTMIAPTTQPAFARVLGNEATRRWQKLLQVDPKVYLGPNVPSNPSYQEFLVMGEKLFAKVIAAHKSPDAAPYLLDSMGENVYYSEGAPAYYVKGFEDGNPVFVGSPEQARDIELALNVYYHRAKTTRYEVDYDDLSTHLQDSDFCYFVRDTLTDEAVASVMTEEDAVKTARALNILGE